MESGGSGNGLPVSGLKEQWRLLQEGGPQFVAAVLGLGGLVLVLLLGGIIGVFSIAGEPEFGVASGPGGSGGSDPGALTGVTTPDGQPVDPNDPLGPQGPLDAQGNPTNPGRGGTAPGGGTSGGGGSNTTPGATTPGGGGTTQVAGDRTGVSASTIKWGLHAPKTFNGAPLNLAEDPLEGVDIFIKALNNRGIHGRKIDYVVEDDRYTVDGGQRAAQALVNGYKPFFVSGTLGVDQVYQVALEAKKRNTPYMAAGGPEGLFKDIGMFQITSSYDQLMVALADFLGVETKRQGSPYFGLKKIGISQLNSPFMDGPVNSLKAALPRNGLEFTVLTKIEKPDQQTTYSQECSDLSRADILVPVQDPITTSRMVAECGNTVLLGKMWTFSNFAHDSDVALTLMQGSWTGVRGISNGCYYLPKDGKNPYAPACGALKTAHEQWAQINGEDDWVKDGQGGAAGYQIVHFWTKALTDAGPDPTRERLVAALSAYDGYANLVTAPLTFKGSPNRIIGAKAWVPYEALSDRTYKQLTPGFVSQF
ncbi:MAG: ABC transporter substrate-binding protein [Acidimicrobiales bacterium]